MQVNNWQMIFASPIAGICLTGILLFITKKRKTFSATQLGILAIANIAAVFIAFFLIDPTNLHFDIFLRLGLILVF